MFNLKKNKIKKNKRKVFDVSLQFAEIGEAYQLLKKINSVGKSIKNLTDEQLKNKTRFFKQRLSRGETLKDIRIEAFAVAREATFRVLGKRPYDVQMIGGLILDMGSVAEMKTGEGKTITSIAPIYLNALTGDGVIVSTVNEYLAERDSKELGEVFSWLGLTVGLNQAGSSTFSKKIAYNADITYSIHSELGFDYLRDNIAKSLDDRVQRGLNFALIDEVDSILIDEAKTPLIISGGEDIDSSLYENADLFVKSLNPEDYNIDYESHIAFLTHKGVNKANKWYKVNNIYKIENTEIVHRIQNSLRANIIMKRDVEYVVLGDKIELVDQFTGRIMEGRAYSEGLQQAIQAKEGIKIEPETKTLATITYQNFFRMFKKLSGMTGTAKTEEQEFLDTYNMRVNVVPTHKPIQRIDHKDQIYVTFDAKFKAIVKEIKRLYEKGQPVLVGTAQIEESEYLHNLLLKENIPHVVLNAKQNAAEAEIISKAGVQKAVTIATNMAGRGTDIKLGEGVKELGGLFVLGTNKAEARRIDNQLKGRSGRQGDIGESKFFLSVEDQLIKRFSLQDKWKEMFKNYGDKEIPGKTIQKAFEKAQIKIEGFNYDSRKSVLNYDDVIRKQRELLYAQRNIVLVKENVRQIVKKMIKNVSEQIFFIPGVFNENGTINYKFLVNYINEKCLSKLNNNKININDVAHLPNDIVKEYIYEYLTRIYDEYIHKFQNVNSISSFNSNEKSIVLDSIDRYWQDHINIMDKLRSSSNVMQYSQKNPYQVYTEEGSNKFNEMIDKIALSSIQLIFTSLKDFEHGLKEYNHSSSMTREMNEEIQKQIDNFMDSLKANNKTLNDEIEIEITTNDPLFNDLVKLDSLVHNFTSKIKKQ